MRKEEVKLSVFTDEMVLYVENPKDHPHTHNYQIQAVNSGKLQI